MHGIQYDRIFVLSLCQITWKIPTYAYHTRSNNAIDDIDEDDEKKERNTAIKQNANHSTKIFVSVADIGN